MKRAIKASVGLIVGLLLWLITMTHTFRECEEFDFDLVTSRAIEGTFEVGFWAKRDPGFREEAGLLREFSIELGAPLGSDTYRAVFSVGSVAHPCQLEDFLGTAIIHFEQAPPGLTRDSLMLDRTRSPHGCGKETLWLGFGSEFGRDPGVMYATYRKE